MNIAKLKTAIRHPRLFVSNLQPWDYTAANLEPVPTALPQFFPNMICRESFTLDIPHIGRIDRRFPVVGFVTADEGSLIYNYGKMLGGRRFLEIGCWVGWSTVILGLSGVQLTVIDPILGGDPEGEACRDSLERAGLKASVRLFAGNSPQLVTKLTDEGECWDGFFIDGNHEGDAPLRDAQACAKSAGPNSIIIFHDLIQPNIADDLKWLQSCGWSCGVHYTAMFVGVAWRGTCQPLSHEPDPKVNWSRILRGRARHLNGFTVL